MLFFVHVKTLKEAEFNLITAHGISEASYKHCEKFPIHGTGQGSTNSPMIWCFISSVLFECHLLKAHGATYVSLDGKWKTRINMVGFVDNSTCVTSGDKNTTFDELKQMMTEDAKLWHDLLCALGGKLSTTTGYRG